MKEKCSLKEKDLSGKHVLVRADLNVPIDAKGRIRDMLRIRKFVPTAKHLLKQGCSVVVLVHFKRTKPDDIESGRLDSVAHALSEELKAQVVSFADCLNPEIHAASKKLQGKGLVLADNGLNYEQDKTNNASYVKQLSEGFDAFVNDAFVCSHRKHGSIYGVSSLLDSCMGFALEKELLALKPFVDQSIDRPAVLVLGGTRLHTKEGILTYFMDKVDHILVGGALANTLLMAQGFDTGSSIEEEEHFDLAQDLMLKAESSGSELLLPVDVKVADDLTEDATTITVPVEDVIGSMKIGDIGPHTIAKYKAIIHHAKTLLWFGPMGIHEMDRFSRGSKEIAEAIAESDAYSIVAGGKTLDVLSTHNISQSGFSHVSTGGSALTEFLSGKKLPGIDALPDA